MREYHKNIVAVYIIFHNEGKVLLLRRANTGYEDGSYSLVAGHVEAGESCMTAAIREAQEEAGVRIRQEHLEFAHVMHRKGDDGNERVDVFFSVDDWEGTIINNEPRKCDDLSWFDLSMLPPQIIPCVKQALEALRDKKMYSEWGWK